MDIIKIINYTRLPNLVILILGLFQPGESVALPILEGESDFDDLLPYLKQGSIEIQWYRKEELEKRQQAGCSPAALLLPIQWAAHFSALCKHYQRKSPLVLLECSDKQESPEDMSETMEFMQIQIYSKSLKSGSTFRVNCQKDLLLKLQRMSCYDMVDIPSFPKNDR